MALEIKITPTLTGKVAEKFLKKLKENENRKVSKEEIERIKGVYKAVLKNAIL